MKKTKLLVATALLMLAGSVARADSVHTDSAWNDRMRFDREGPEAFPGNQFDVDLFGSWANHDRFGRKGDRWGGGVGVDYFITRYLGVGADTYLEEWRWPYRVNGSLILRLPLQHRGFGFAPYGFGGGGREFKYTPQYTAHAGGGLEFRFNRYTGVFGDIRRVFTDKSPDYTMIRTGITLGF